MRQDDRGVSDVLAFALIFAVMIASVGIIGAVGFQTVGDISEEEQLRSAELSMAELAQQLSGIADHEAPVRASELRTGGATVSITDDFSMQVTVLDGAGQELWNGSFDLGTVTYRLDGTTILVAGGAVIRANDGHAVMLEDPPFLVTESAARLNLLRVDPHGDVTSITTAQLVQMQSHHQGTQLLEPFNRSHLYDIDTIQLELDGADAVIEAWNGYLETHDMWDGNSSTNVWESSGFEDGVILRHSRISIRFIS